MLLRHRMTGKDIHRTIIIMRIMQALIIIIIGMMEAIQEKVIGMEDIEIIRQ